MVELEKKQLCQISGGGFSSFFTGCVILASAFSFIIGVFDGFVRPLKCNR